jgi:heptosyltransferase I
MIVLIQLDKIGNLVSTLPVDEIFPTELQSERHWVVAKGLGFLPKLASPARPYSEVDTKEQFLAFLRKHKPRAAIVFGGPWWVSYYLWREGVQIRIGVRSLWHNYLFLKYKMSQTRMLSEKHEADYNADLLRFAWEVLTHPRFLFKSSYGGKLQHNIIVTPRKSNVPAPVLKLVPPDSQLLLERMKINSKKFVVVHPGLESSKLNWSQSHWNELIAKLVEKTVVVITGKAADETWLTEIKLRWAQHPKVHFLQEQVDLIEITSLLAHSNGLISNSTDILHIGASVGVPVLGMYSPLESHHPNRWAPRSTIAAKDLNSVTIITPPVECPSQMRCLSEKCVHFSCMEKIAVNEVFATAEKMMGI